MVKRYTVNTKRTYTKDGDEKTIWNRVGTIVQFEDGLGFEWFVQPDTKFFVFEDKPREEKKDYGKAGNTDVDYPAPADESVPF